MRNVLKFMKQSHVLFWGAIKSAIKTPTHTSRWALWYCCQMWKCHWLEHTGDSQTLLSETPFAFNHDLCFHDVIFHEITLFMKSNFRRNKSSIIPWPHQDSHLDWQKESRHLAPLFHLKLLKMSKIVFKN